MISPKTTSKRAGLPRRSDRSKEFTKDWERLTRSGRYNMNTLKQVMLLLIENAEPLPAEWKDHALSGRDWSGYRECHVGGDFLLVYQIRGIPKNEEAYFVRAGTHSELFG